VAIAAIDANTAGMVLVAELHRLFAELVRGSDDVGPLQRKDQPAQSEQCEDHCEHTGV
jgi:hypothetical protein